MNRLNDFPKINLHQYIIMSNHIHGIIQTVGADLRVCPPIIDNNDEITENNEIHDSGQTRRSAPTGNSALNTVVQWFKTMSTNEYIRGVNNNIFPPFNKRMGSSVVSSI